MPGPAITFSPHAKQRLEEREITERQVRIIIGGGSRTPEASSAGERRRWRYLGRINGRSITVITAEDSEAVLVVTVF